MGDSRKGFGRFSSGRALEHGMQISAAASPLRKARNSSPSRKMRQASPTKKARDVSPSKKTSPNKKALEKNRTAKVEHSGVAVTEATTATSVEGGLSKDRGSSNKQGKLK